MQAQHREAIPLEQILVEGSTYNRHNLKHRLYAAGLKQPVCETCGQDELWYGRVMAMILDHINGVPDDNRIENLRIVCPNCAATLDTHCGRKNQARPIRVECKWCSEEFFARNARQEYCSIDCGMLGGGQKIGDALRGVPRPERRKVERPPYDQLKAELAASNYCAVARKYGVSDNAVRKWLKFYEREQRRAARAHDADLAA